MSSTTQTTRGRDPDQNNRFLRRLIWGCGDTREPIFYCLSCSGSGWDKSPLHHRAETQTQTQTQTPTGNLDRHRDARASNPGPSPGDAAAPEPRHSSEFTGISSAKGQKQKPFQEKAEIKIIFSVPTSKWSEFSSRVSLTQTRARARGSGRTQVIKAGPSHRTPDCRTFQMTKRSTHIGAEAEKHWSSRLTEFRSIVWSPRLFFTMICWFEFFLLCVSLLIVLESRHFKQKN